MSNLERARGFTQGDDSNSLNSGFLFRLLLFLVNSFHFTEPIERIPDPHIINKSRLLNKRLTINVGGVRHEVSLLHIGCLPHYISHSTFHITFHRCCGSFSLLCPSPGWAFSPELEPTRRSSLSAAIIPSLRTSSSSTDTPDPSTPSSISIGRESCTWLMKCASLPLERISTIGASAPTT